MSVNVSGRQFDSDLVSTVATVLTATGIEPSTLCLEVTASMVMKDVDTAVSTLRELKPSGSCCPSTTSAPATARSATRQFPLDELKIDKSFVDGLGRETDDGAIVAAVMGMARALELTVVAEGVETEGQAASLRMLGCETAQGFHFSRPHDADTITGLLATEAIRRRQGATTRERPTGAAGTPVPTRSTRPAGFARAPK